MLGGSTAIAGPPAALVYALRAARVALDRAPARWALVLAICECAGLAVLLVGTALA